MEDDDLTTEQEEHLKSCGGRCANCNCSHEPGRAEDGTPLCDCGEECDNYVPTWEHSDCWP